MKPPLEAVVKTYQSHLYAAAFAVCKNTQDAEDAVQDTFLQYWSQKKEFETEQHVRAWLLRVAINRAKNRAHTFFRRKVLPLEDYMESLTFESEESSEVFEAVMALPEKYRSVLHLYYYEGYATDEIAAILGRRAATVRSQLSRGRALLRDAWKGAEDV